MVASRVVQHISTVASTIQTLDSAADEITCLDEYDDNKEPEHEGWKYRWGFQTNCRRLRLRDKFPDEQVEQLWDIADNIAWPKNAGLE